MAYRHSASQWILTSGLHIASIVMVRDHPEEIVLSVSVPAPEEDAVQIVPKCTFMNL